MEWKEKNDSMIYSHESINELKHKARLTDIISKYIQLKKHGSEFVACCPFHKERTPSFKVPANQDFYKCFGCGKSGDVFDFVMNIENCNFYDAVKKVAANYNFELEGEIKEYKPPIKRLEKLSPKLIEWFEKRGISNNTLLRFGITEATEWMPKAAKETTTICFNYYRDEQLINIKFRAAQKDFKMAKDAELIFYNIDAIKGEDTAIIVEGEIDALSMYEAGIYNVVSVPNGTTPKGSMRLQYLDNCAEYFSDKSKIILALDNDDVGKRLQDELARRFGRDRCLFVEYPTDCKDANDVLQHHGRSALALMVEQAKQFPIEGIVNSDELSDEILRLYDEGYPRGVKAGIHGFDDHLSFMEGQMTIITGIPGSGKSEFTDYIMSEITLKHQWKWAVCSFENTPPVFHATKILEKLSGYAFDYRLDHNNRIQRADLEMLNKYLSMNFFFINTNEADITIDGLLSKAAELVFRKGIKGLLIDPWNYIEHAIPAGQSETQYISDCLTKIKKAAQKLGIHIFIIAHPTKLIKDKSTGKYEVPTLYSISGSAHFFNKTDNGITVYRDFETNVVTVYVQKVRYSWLGKIGYNEFNYNTLTRQYSSINLS